MQVTSGGETLLHSDLHIQSSLPPINETSNRARLPPPFCPHSLSIESKQLDLFPDAVCETATRIYWLSPNTAPTPEHLHLAADSLESATCRERRCLPR